MLIFAFLQNDADKDSIGDVEIFPRGGFNIAHYFPYMNQPGYRAPLVMAKFNNAAEGTLIQV